VQVSELHIYPIKSCRGIAVPSAEVEARGLACDRRYMLVDAKGRFLTQREHPRMALIDVQPAAGGWRVAAPDRPPLHVPVRPAGGRECEVNVWRDTVQATLAPEDLNFWFSEFMGFACGLVYMDEHQHRPVTHASAEFDDEVGFADSAPLLLISAGSLADLNGRLAKPVTMRHFRPNIVVDGAAPFAEDAWRTIGIGGAEFAVAWPCSRCVLTTIDPATGEKDARGEPLETLKSYRRVGARVMFGQNLIPRSFGAVRLGDAVHVL
jgi:uncharacterized protein